MHLPKLFCKMSVVERVKYVKLVSKVSNYLITKLSNGLKRPNG